MLRRQHVLLPNICSGREPNTEQKLRLNSSDQVKPHQMPVQRKSELVRPYSLTRHAERFDLKRIPVSSSPGYHVDVSVENSAEGGEQIAFMRRPPRSCAAFVFLHSTAPLDIFHTRRTSSMVNKITDPLSYATDADESILKEIARLDGLRVRSKTSVAHACGRS